jgi:transcription antitermination factor NusG
MPNVDTLIRRDWRRDYTPAHATDMAGDPLHYTLQYYLPSEVALCRVLRHVGFEPIILTFSRRLPRNRGVLTRHWLPGYLFLRFDAGQDRWQQVRRAPGAVDFLGDPPQPISDADFTDLRLRCPPQVGKNDQWTVIPVGSEIEVLSGPFADRTAVVTSSKGKSVRVVMCVFNAPTSVELLTKQVRILR